MKLTAKQEKFAQLLAEGRTQADAYRGAYDVAQYTPQRVAEAASRLAASGKIRARVEELLAPARAAVQRRLQVTIESLTAELEEARQLALETRQPSALVSATLGKARLHGFDVARVERKNVDEFSSGALAERQAQLDAALAIRKARERSTEPSKTAPGTSARPASALTALQRSADWKKANPEKYRTSQRELMRKRRAEGRA